MLAKVAGRTPVERVVSSGIARPSVPPPEWDALIASARRIFNARIVNADELDEDMRDRLAMIDAILAQRDDKGRSSYTGTQVESCAIGLRRHAGSHPAIDVMLARLLAAKKNALSARNLRSRPPDRGR